MEHTESREERKRRCLTCGVLITGGQLPFCSHRHFTYSVFGEPALTKAKRKDRGDLWPVEKSDRVRQDLHQARSAFTRRRKAATAPDATPPGSIHDRRELTLSDWEVHYLKRFAKEINRLHRDTGANRNVSGDDDLKLNVLGFAGEFAFAKLFNVFPDLFTLEVRKQSHRAGGVDAHLPNGLRVDVKTTGRDPSGGGFGITIEANKDEDAADVYVLMGAAQFPTVRYVGFIPTYHAHTGKYATDWGHFVPAEALRKSLPVEALHPYT